MLTETFACTDRFTRDLVSVIIAVYQGERFVLGAIRSALRQTYENLEIIVVDDGSTDGTAAALSAISDPRITVITQKNSGTASARNAALAVARGKFIAFLDADDRWFADKLEIEVALLSTTHEPAIAYSSFYVVDDRGRLQRPGAICWRAGNIFEELLEGDNFLVPSLCLFDRAIFDSVGVFDVTRYHEDFDFFLRVTRQFQAFPTGRRLGLFRHSTDGKCRGILQDFERARREELDLVAGLSDRLSVDESRRLKTSVLRSLYERFLTYGYSAHAKRLQAEVDLACLARTWKGRLALLFAITGLNALSPARRAMNALCSIALSRRLRRGTRLTDFDGAYS